MSDIIIENKEVANVKATSNVGAPKNVSAQPLSSPTKKDEEPKKYIENTNKSRNVISRQKLLEHGVHFGHKKNRWNPKMKPYIQGIKQDTHIINLDKTVNSLNISYKALYEITKKGGKILFVGTKKQVANSIKQNAIRSNSFYINHRWLGGTLTNFQTIRKSIERYKELERLGKDNFQGYSKKEAVDMYKELKKMELSLGGIKFMRHKPSAIVLSSSMEDGIALKEAMKLNIPIFAVVDSNADPDGIMFKIPANDDANKAQSLIITILADAICDAKGLPRKAALVEEDLIEVLGINPKVERPEGRYGRKPSFGARRFDSRKPFVPRTYKKPFNKDDSSKPPFKSEFKKPTENKPVVDSTIKTSEVKMEKTTPTTPTTPTKLVETKPIIKTEIKIEVKKFEVKPETQKVATKTEDKKILSQENKELGHASKEKIHALGQMDKAGKELKEVKKLTDNVKHELEVDKTKKTHAKKIMDESKKELAHSKIEEKNEKELLKKDKPTTK